MLGITLESVPAIFYKTCTSWDILKNKVTPGSRMQIFLFILDVARSCNKYYLPSKTQVHTVISTCTRARRKFDFFAQGWFLFNSTHFDKENYDVMLILDESIKLHENKVPAKTFMRVF